jgi:zinc protease
LLNFYNTFAGDPGAVNTDLDRYQAVTAADVLRVANRYLTGGRVRLVINPKEQVTPLEAVIDRTVQPGPGRPRRFEPPTPRRIALSGGMDLLVVEKHEVPLIAAGIYVPGGAVLDPDDCPGISSFTGRLITEGTKTRSSTQIADEGDFIAAPPNVGVDRENVVVTTESLTRHWERALDLWADVVLNPTFPDEEIERVRKERLTDLRRLRDDPNAIAERVATGLLFGRDTPHGHPISGREAATEAISRDAILAQYERTFAGARPTFFVVGDVDTERVVRQIEDAFKDLRPAPGTVEERAAVTERGMTTLYLVDKPGAAQSVIAAGQVGVPRNHPDYIPLTVMNMAFGGQFTARLNMNLREDKGYTYGYRSRFDWRKSASSYIAGGSVQTDVTREALFETLKEYRDLHHDRPINQSEFEKAQMGLIRGFPPTFETPSHVLRRLLDIVHFGLPDDYFSGQVARFEAMTLEDVRRVAAEHVDPDALSILVVGDSAQIEGPMRELGLPIVHLDYEGEVIA